MMELAMGRWQLGHRAMEVECANGYIAYLLSSLGYKVDAVDAYDDPDRDKIFATKGVNYSHTNLNDVDPLADIPSSTYDLLLFGEVFEHILNQPAGLLRSSLRVLRPGGDGDPYNSQPVDSHECRSSSCRSICSLGHR